MRTLVPAILAVTVTACAGPEALPASAAPTSAPTPPPAATDATASTTTPTEPRKTAETSTAEAPKRASQLTPTPDDKLGTAPPNLGLKVGDKAPSMTLADAAGGNVKLADVYAKGPTFIVFYRGGWCPFCNVQMHQLGEAKPDFDAKGLKIVAISVDQPSEEAKTQAKQSAPFPFLSDANLAAHKAFRVVHAPPPEEKAALAKYGVSLETYSGQTHGSFAVPSIFLVDRKGVIRFVHVDEEYKTRPSPAQMLSVAQKLGL